MESLHHFYRGSKIFLLKLLFIGLRDPMSQLSTKTYFVNQCRINSRRAQKVTKHDVRKEGQMKVIHIYDLDILP